MIDPELLPEFVAEAGEHLDEMEANLIKLETDPDDREIINDIFRDVHTIKGSSAYLGLKVTSELAHKLENLLEMVRQGKCNADSSLIDTLIAGKDRLASLVADIESYQEERTEIDDLIQAILSCATEPHTNDKKVGNSRQATNFEEDINQMTATLDGFSLDAAQSSSSGSTDSGLPRENASSEDSQEALISFTEEEFRLDLDGIFDTEENQSNGLADTIESRSDSPAGSSSREAMFAPRSPLSEDKPVESEIRDSYEETGDEELFTIYLEQLRLNFSDIRELAVQLPVSEHHSQLLSGINEKIQRLKASANYMGYDKLSGLYESWQGKLESFQDRLFLNDAPSCDVLIEEGINAYFETIQKHFPQLRDVALIPLAGEEQNPSPSQPASSEISEVDGKEKSGTEDAFTEEEFRLDLEGVFDAEENQSSDSGHAIESEAEESYEENGDEELFSIYLEQLKLNLSDIRELAVQIPASENRSRLLSGINEKIERLKASANYMGYDKLTGLYDRWLAKLETFQDRLFLNEAPSSDVLLEEGINTYFETIRKHFPQLQEIASIPVTGEEQAQFPGIGSQEVAGIREKSAPLAEDEYDENIDSELFSIFLEQLKDNLHAVRTLERQLSTSENPAEVVNALTEKISRIRAAANYMGYEKLTGLYDEWLGVLSALRDPSSLPAEGVAFSSQISSCLRTYTERVLKIFPQLGEIEPVAADEEETNVEEQVPATPLSSTKQTEPTYLSESSLLVDRTDELFSSDDASIEEEADFYELPDVTEEKIENAEKDQVLIDRLSAALDSALAASVEEEGSVDLGTLGEITAKVEPEKSPRIPEKVAEDTTEERTVSPEMPEPEAAATTPEESVGPEGENADTVAVPEQVERRKEERRKEDRRGATESGVDKVFRQSLRIDANKIDELMNQAGELVINRAWFSQLFNEMRQLELHLQNIPELDKRDFKQVKGFSFKFHEAIVALGRVANELQEGVMKVRMLPISQLFNRYPRLVRDLVHDSDKDIQLVLRGADTELDKMIIEEIADPMIHVIRNAVDHGIEPASIRREMGKPEKGLLKLDAYHEGSHVVIEVTDDGRGINLEAIKSTALKKGLVNKDQLSRMSPKEITELIMRPGFSTAAQITRTSGRGVGMDVVRKNLENLNGTIEIDSQLGKGTSIRIKIPLTLAVIKALLVKVRGALFTIPLIAVDETLQVRVKDISSIKGNEVIYLRDSTIPLIRLSNIFNLPNRASQGTDEEKTFVVIVSAGNSRVGLVVDELRGQEEVVIKPLPDYLRDNKGFSGATILGDGRISLILDIHELVNLTIGRQSRRLSESSRILSEKL